MWVTVYLVFLMSFEKHFPTSDWKCSANGNPRIASKIRIERFHSRDQLCLMKQNIFCITKELNSHKTDVVHQYGRLFIV